VENRERMAWMGCWKGGELVSCNPKGVPGAEERFWWLERSDSLGYKVKSEVETMTGRGEVTGRA
jgi:hypothetical protein